MRNVPDPEFAGDAGGADSGLAAALAAYSGDPGLHTPTLAVLQHARLLVPLLAVLMRGRDGRLALLAFTSTGSMGAWDPEARPVPVPAAHAARAAVQENATALVLDVAGPVMFVVEEADLRSLSDGYNLVGIQGAYGWAKVAR